VPALPGPPGPEDLVDAGMLDAGPDADAAILAPGRMEKPPTF